jgi:hypothetical protein
MLDEEEESETAPFLPPPATAPMPDQVRNFL